MNLRKKIIVILCVILFTIIGFNTKVKAVSAKISASPTEVTVGTKVTVTTTINGASWEVHLSGAVSDSYADNTDDAEDKTITKTTSFTPTSSGTYTVNLSGNVTGGNDTKSTPVSDSIKIVAKETQKEEDKPTTNTTNNTETTAPVVSKSNNANLKNLGIKPNDFTGFKAGTTTYNVTVPNDVDKVTVYADKSDEKATVTGVGSKKLEVGKNALAVTVTAEDGTKKIYTLNVTREEENATNSTVDDKTTNELVENKVEDNTTTTTTVKDSDLEKLEVVGFTISPKFSPDVFEYKLQVKQDVEELKIETEGASDKVKIDVAGNTSLQMGENVITVLVTNEETNKTSTYQIIVEKVDESEASNINHALIKGNKIRRILISAFIVVIIVVVITVVVLNKRNVDDRYAQYKYEEDDEEKLDLNKEEEFFNRVNRTKLSKIEPEEDFTPEEETKTNFRVATKLKEQKENVEEDGEEEAEEFFRTSKKRGKHF